MRKGSEDKPVRYAFPKDLWADMYASAVLGGQRSGGSEIGEVFAAARAIRKGDPPSWQRAFAALAARLEDLAVESEKNGHVVSARETYQRAGYYHRAALLQMGPTLDPTYRHHVERQRALFRHAAAMFDPPIARFDVPFGDGVLPGYFLRGDATSGRAKTLLLVGGADTIVEDLYYVLGRHAARRGYHVVMVDLPGQGATAFDGFVMRPDVEVPMRVVLEEAEARLDIDPDRLAAYGMSLGGYFVPRAAAAGLPFKAIVANAIIPDFYAHWMAVPQIERFAAWEGTWKLDLLSRLAPSQFRVMAKALDMYQWKWGVDSFSAYLDTVRDWCFDPADITCPTLLLCPQEEYEEHEVVRARQRDALARIDHPRKEEVILPTDLGAGAHIGAANFTIVARATFDWLDEALED